MQTVQQILQEKVQSALAASGVDLSQVPADVLQVVPCANPQFGDYQFNGALPLAKNRICLIYGSFICSWTCLPASHR